MRVSPCLGHTDDVGEEWEREMTSEYLSMTHPGILRDVSLTGPSPENETIVQHSVLLVFSLETRQDLQRAMVAVDEAIGVNVSDRAVLRVERGERDEWTCRHHVSSPLEWVKHTGALDSGQFRSPADV